MTRKLFLSALALLALATGGSVRVSAQANEHRLAASLSLAGDEGQTFADVSPIHPYYAEIEWLYQNGHTAGCAVEPLRYCPDVSMNRAGSAVFVERGIHHARYEPATPTRQVFADLALDSWAAEWVKGLWLDQYTAGCGTDPLIYCPRQGHTRAEGGVLYLRMLHGANYEPVQPTRQTFVDVSLEAWYAKWVEAAFDAGLITPCESSPDMRFCPDDPLSRGLAAHMMFQAKSGLEPTPIPGNVYHVSRTGNDGDGMSWTTAWNELDQIDWNVIRPGDTIEIDGGANPCPSTGADYSSDSCGMVYNITLKVNASGQAGNPITVKLSGEANRNGTVVLDGGVVGAKPCPGYPGGQYPDFAVPSSPGLIDPNSPHSFGVELGSSQWVIVDGTKWGGIEIRNHSRIGFYLNRSQHSSFGYLKIHHNRGEDGWTAGVTADYLSNFNTVSYSEVFGSGQDAIHLHGSNFVLQYSYLHDHFCYHPDGIQGFVPTVNANIPDDAGQIDNLTVRYNVIQNFRNLVDNAGYHGQGVFIGETGYHESWVNGAQIYDNLIVGTAGSSIITKNPRSTKFDVHNNTVASSEGAGLNWTAGGATAPMSIRSNVFYDLNWGFWLLTSNGTTQFLENCVYLANNPGPSDSVTESGTIRQDPWFADVAIGDYSLLPEPPCTGKGSSITSVDDLLGQQAPPTPPLSAMPVPHPADLYRGGQVIGVDPGTGLGAWDISMGPAIQAEDTSQKSVAHSLDALLVVPNRTLRPGICRGYCLRD